MAKLQLMRLREKSIVDGLVVEAGEVLSVEPDELGERASLFEPLGGPPDDVEAGEVEPKPDGLKGPMDDAARFDPPPPIDPNDTTPVRRAKA